MIDISTGIFLLILLLSAVAWEIYAVISGKPTISGTIWYVTVDRWVEGAPLVMIAGYFAGHFFVGIDYGNPLDLYLKIFSVSYVLFEFAGAIRSTMVTPAKLIWEISRWQILRSPIVFLLGFIGGGILFPR